MDDTWLTVEEIAGRLKVTEQTVRRWLRSGSLVGRNFGGRTGYRIRQSDLRPFLESEPKGKAAA